MMTAVILALLFGIFLALIDIAYTLRVMSSRMTPGEFDQVVIPPTIRAAYRMFKRT